MEGQQRPPPSRTSPASAHHSPEAPALQGFQPTPGHRQVTTRKPSTVKATCATVLLVPQGRASLGPALVALPALVPAGAAAPPPSPGWGAPELPARPGAGLLAATCPTQVALDVGPGAPGKWQFANKQSRWAKVILQPLCWPRPVPRVDTSGRRGQMCLQGTGLCGAVSGRGSAGPSRCCLPWRHLDALVPVRGHFLLRKPSATKSQDLS